MEGIKCNKGKCYDEESIDHELDIIYGQGDIAEQIQADLIRKMI